MPGLLPLALSRRRPGRIRPSLDRLADALRHLGNPQDAFPSVLVVGTNGKGSTAAMTERILSAAGARIGLATSPHLVRVNERIRVDGSEIKDDHLGVLLDRLEAFPELTFFETLTAAAFMFFAESGVEIAVLEAGMGGRWDASRAAGSAVAGLTNVGSDHRRWLGERLETIADDKGSALAAAERGIFGPQVEPWVMERLALPGAREASALVEVQAPSDDRVLHARWAGSDWIPMTIPLEGAHQRANLHLALALAEACREMSWIGLLSSESVVEALGETRWPGRLSTTTIAGRSVLLDGAHNLEAVESLAVFLRAQPVLYNMVFSCLDDKPIREMAAVLRPVVGDIVVCVLDDPRAMPVDSLLEAFPGAVVAQDPGDALASLGDPILAAGSLRLVGFILDLVASPQ